MKSKELKRFFMVYISFFTCLALLFIPLYSMALSLYTEKSLKTNEEMLQRGMLSLESELNGIYQAGLAMFQDSSFSTLGSSNLPLSSHRIYMMKRSGDMVRNVFLYMGKQLDAGLVMPNGIVLTNTGSCYTDPSQFYGQFLAYEGYATFDDWFAYLTDFQGNYSYKGSDFITSSGKAYEGMTYVQRLPLNTKQNRFILYATMDKNYVKQMLILPGMMASAMLYLTDGDGNILIASEANPDTHYATISATSGTYGITATVGIDSMLFKQEMRPLRTLALAFALTYLLAGLVLSMLFSWHSFKPVAALMRSIRGLNVTYNINKQLPAHFKTEYEYIQDFLVQTDSVFKTYEAALEQQRGLLRSHMLSRLLSGQIYSERTFETAKEYFPGFPQRYRVVQLRLHLKKQLTLSDFSKQQILWLSVIRRFLPESTIRHFMSNFLVLVLPWDESVTTERIRETLTQMREALLSTEQTSCSIAVSSCFSGIENLAEAHHQTLNLLRQITESEPDRQFIADDVNYDQFFAYQIMNSVDTNRFCELLRRAQAQSAKDMIGRTKALVTGSPGCAEEYLLCVFFAYKYCFLLICNELKCNHGEQISDLVFNQQISVQKLFEHLTDYVDLICESVVARNSASAESLAENVKGFIDENYANPDLYIKKVTDRFSISEHSLQRIIREATGKSFFEYLEHLRMEFAWQLITKDKLPLQEVIRNCGYTSHNSFYKAFKRNFGMSPSAAQKPMK